jgi:hypothetical protein
VGLAPRRLLERAYVFVNSMLLVGLGTCIAPPWSGLYESFQLPRAASRLLKRTGLADVQIQEGRHFRATSNKAVIVDGN